MIRSEEPGGSQTNEIYFRSSDLKNENGVLTKASRYNSIVPKG
ncbi:hypothetical protein ABN763_15820 [Spongiivirga sp. MCCC 1A20706]